MGDSSTRKFSSALSLGLLCLLVCTSLSSGQTKGLPLEKDVTLTASPCLFSYEGPQPFDVLHYRLDVDLAMVDDGFSGKSTMSIRLKTSIDSLVLNAVGLSLDTIKVEGFTKIVTADSAMEQFVIHLGHIYSMGDTLQVEIFYRRIHGYPRPSSRQGYYFFADTIGLPANLGYTFSEPSDARFWFPCYDQPWDKATAEMNITVPDGYVAASNGRLVETIVNGDGTVTWRWRDDHRIATYLMCITVSRFTISTIPYVAVTGDTIPLQYFAWPSDSASAATFLPTVKQMIACYAGLYGEYPFDKYGMSSIVPFTFLGMEHQSMTTLNRYVQTDQRTVSHELAHQWWGDNVTCGTWADIWLNESFATYSEALWRESTGGASALKRYMLDTLDGFRFGSWQGAVYDPVGQGFNLFDQVVYSKGAWVLHTLRGALGDSLFFKSLSAYRDRFEGKSTITSELIVVIDSVAGQDMNWFFDQWIFGPGWPKYALQSAWVQDTLTLVIYQQQSSLWPTYRMPVQVRVYHGGDSTNYTVWDSLRTQMFLLPLAFAPDSVSLDPDGWILKQIVSPPASVEDNLQPRALQLYQNYPNPFNPTTSISFQLSTAGLVSLRIFDVLGREIATLVNEVRAAGRHTVVFDASNLSSGIYMYSLVANNARLYRKMLLLR